jgi:SNF2 family DNA or RNA helicase
MTTAFAHQKKSIAHSAKTDIVYDCSDPGTGKTFVRIKVYEARHKGIKKKSALVLAPRSLLRSVWAADFKKFAPKIKVNVATADVRAETFAEPADVYVTNLDAVKWLAKQPKKFFEKFFEKFDEIIIDESSAYKHATSQRSKAVAKIAKFFKYRTCMTGTPNGRSITDVWHQVFILDGGKRLGPSFYAFRNSVCEPTQVGRTANAMRWDDKDGAEEAVFNLLKDIVIRHKFEDCVDIPPNHRYDLTYDLTPKHRKAYEELEATQMLLLKAKTPANASARLLGEKPKDFHVVSAINAAVVAGKLLQIASGAVYESPDKYHLIDDGRYKMILDLVEERQHSLVFFHWKHQRDLLVAEAEKRGISFCIYDGSVGDKERTVLEQQYQAGMFRVMFAHPKSAAHGLTLTKGTTTIWASPTYNAETDVQGSKRQHRIGQTQKTETITIIAAGTIDERADSLRAGKSARMTNLLDLFGIAA